MKTIEMISPAKINLDLKIGSFNNKNSLHNIKTKMQKINLVDNIFLKKIPTKNRQKILIKISGKQKKNLPTNGDNLVFKAAKIFFKETKIKDSLEIHLQKNIPQLAGLGGASSNAAKVLKGMEKLYEQKIDFKKLINLGYCLGSDVPFFISQQNCAQITGTGEQIKKVFAEKFYVSIFMLPKIFISTKWAFQKFAELKNKKNLPANNFEKMIFYFFPDLLELKQELLKYTEKVGLSGTGSALFALFKNKEKQKKCNEKIKKKCSFFWMGETL